VGLDVYVGPWLRYYRGDWLTPTQQMAANLGVPAYVSRPGSDGGQVIVPAGPPEKVNTPEEIRSLIGGWQAAFAGLLADKAFGPIDWPESQDGDYLTARPDWSGYNAIRLLAAHEQFPTIPLPDLMREAASKAISEAIDLGYGGQLPPPKTRWSLWGKNNVEDTVVRFDHVLRPILWVPVHFDEVVMFMDLVGAPCRVGSIFRLQDELRMLNERTLKMDAKSLQKAVQKGPPPSRSFKWFARFGLGVIMPLVDAAVKRRQPMLLDF
jgi:hypothetical protein